VQLTRSDILDREWHRTRATSLDRFKDAASSLQILPDLGSREITQLVILRRPQFAQKARVEDDPSSSPNWPLASHMYFYYYLKRRYLKHQSVVATTYARFKRSDLALPEESAERDRSESKIARFNAPYPYAVSPFFIVALRMYRQTGSAKDICASPISFNIAYIGHFSLVSLFYRISRVSQSRHLFLFQRIHC